MPYTNGCVCMPFQENVGLEPHVPDEFLSARSGGKWLRSARLRSARMPGQRHARLHYTLCAL
eukprot:4789236-Alexandrium_andersonii.AAC.1